MDKWYVQFIFDLHLFIYNSVIGIILFTFSVQRFVCGIYIIWIAPTRMCD